MSLIATLYLSQCSSSHTERDGCCVKIKRVQVEQMSGNLYVATLRSKRYAVIFITKWTHE